jgi:hypothetical protein
MKIKELMQKVGKLIPYALAAMSVENYIKGKISDNNLNLFLEERRKNAELVQQLQDFSEREVNNSNTQTQILEGVEQVRRSFEQIVKDSTESAAKEFIKKGNEELENIINIIKGSNSSSSFSSSKAELFSNITDFMTIYNDWLNTLPLSHSTRLYRKSGAAIIHILLSISILFCLFSLIGIFFGEELLNYFQIEKRFPKLAKFILLRRKFKKYYFIMNSLLIISSLFLIFFVNVYTILYY